MKSDDNAPIVIAQNDIKTGLLSIAYRGLVHDEIKIHVTDKYLPVARNLIRILRKTFGWVVVSETRVRTLNAVCIFNSGGECTNKDAHFQKKCNEAIRSTCSKYKARFTQKFEVNEIKIEKIAAIRSL